MDLCTHVFRPGCREEQPADHAASLGGEGLGEITA